MQSKCHQQYVKPKPIYCQNQKTDNWKKGSSSPRVASVFDSSSGICLLYTYTYVEMSHQLFILFLCEKIEKRLIRICESIFQNLRWGEGSFNQFLFRHRNHREKSQKNLLRNCQKTHQCPSDKLCRSVRVKSGIQSKRVFTRKFHRLTDYRFLKFTDFLV